MCRCLVVVALIPGLAIGVARAGVVPVQKCASGKEKVVGTAIAAKLACYVKARATGRAVRSACVRRATQKFVATFVKFGTTCPGVASSVETLVDACVGTLVDDVLGTGECPVRAARSVGRAGRGFMVCAAKGPAKPGSLSACNARQNTKLNTALSNAQRCVASSTASDLGAYCIMPLLNALPATVRCGTFLTTWASSAPVGAVAVDGSGNVYVADGVNNRIEKFDSTGTFLTAWGSGASGIAVDGSGNVYVTDLNAARVEKFDSTGTFLTAWGSIGSGPGQFQTAALHAIAVDGSGNV